MNKYEIDDFVAIPALRVAKVVRIFGDTYIVENIGTGNVLKLSEDHIIGKINPTGTTDAEKSKMMFECLVDISMGDKAEAHQKASEMAAFIHNLKLMEIEVQKYLKLQEV